MRIGIDGHVLGKNIGGVERFVRELAQHLPTEAPQHEYIVFVTKAEFAKLQTMPAPNLQYVKLAFSNPLLQRLILMPWLVYRYRLNALLFQRIAPWFCGNCKLIATIHDLTPIKFAQAYQGLSNRLVRLLTKSTIQRASLILTPTKAIKDEIVAYCHHVKAPIVPFYNGVDTSTFKKSASSEGAPLFIQSPYLLTVGAIERRKNLETIFEMLGQVKDCPLVVVGGVRDQPYFDTLQAQLIHLGLLKRVHFMGYMSEEALIQLYQNATVFITASKDEGFNIPPLEAMACGLPVLCSNIPVHQELFAGAAMFFEASSATELAEKVNTLLNYPSMAKNQVMQGQAKVAEFTWQRTAKNVADALRRLEN